MSTRREFLQKAGSGLVVAGAGWFVADAGAAPGGAQPIGSPAGGTNRLPPEPPLPPTPTPTPTATVTSDLSDADLWDGASGVSPTYFNVGALLPWENKGGDWSDALGVPQGSTAFSTGVSGKVGPFAIDATALVQWLQQNSERGIFLKETRGSASVATRTNPDATQRPFLTIVDATGAATNFPCLASAVMNPSTSSPVTGDSLSVGQGCALLLEFDLDSAPAQIAKATLTLTITKSYSVALQLDAFALRRPKIFDGGTPVPGLAAKYTGDAGINADPDVYFATSLDATGLAEYFVGAKLEPDATFGTDPDLGIPALGTEYHVGEFAPFLAVPGHTWSRKSKLGLGVNPHNGLLIRDETPYTQYFALQHPQTPTELYFRYYLKLKAGYQCAVEGKKLPGLAGRYGKWVGTSDTFGYYNPTAGNGGSPTKGTYSMTDGFSGWSMRHHAYSAPTETTNPLWSLIPLNYYAYHAAMTGYYGDFWRWGNKDTGYVNIEMDRWYCLEHYVKVNDVAAPFDSLGNGTGVANGVVRGWIDGVLVFEKTDAVLRKNRAIKVDEVWLDHYHGGTTPAEAEHPLQMAALVVAKSYIGPMQLAATATGLLAGAPAWLNGVAVNEWCAIPGTALSAGTDLSAQIAAGLTDTSLKSIGFGHPRRGIMDFSGGTLKSSGSEMLIFGGGGAGAWAGNDVRGLRLEDNVPRWHTVVNPAPSSAVWPKGASAPTAYMKDGTPNARHSYWQPQFVDSTDTFMTFGCANEWQMDAIETNDVNSVPLHGAWKPAGSHPDIPAKRGYDGSWVCRHPATGQIYAATQFTVQRFDPAANAWQMVVNHGGSAGVDRGVGAIDPLRNILLRIGSAKSDTVHNAPVTIDLATGAWTDAAFSGPFASAIATYTYSVGLVYDIVLKKFLLFQDDGFIYTITFVSKSEWSVDCLALTGISPVAGASGVHSGGPCAVWGRMQYVPNLRGVCIIQAYNKPAYFVRTA